jgi:metal-responsive CopG/Arc/MetJ family transcriptional regulator
MRRTENAKLTAKPEVRLSVSLSQKDHEEVRRMAKAKKVSKAWIIRDAIEKYIQEDAPLLAAIRNP